MYRERYADGIFRGNLLSNTTCIARVFFDSDE